MLFNKSCFSRAKTTYTQVWRRTEGVLHTNGVFSLLDLSGCVPPLLKMEKHRWGVSGCRYELRPRHQCVTLVAATTLESPCSLCHSATTRDLHAPRHTPCVALQWAAVFDCSPPQPPFFLPTRDVLQCSQSVVYYYVLRTSSIPLLF